MGFSYAAGASASSWTRAVAGQSEVATSMRCPPPDGPGLGVSVKHTDTRLRVVGGHVSAGQALDTEVLSGRDAVTAVTDLVLVDPDGGTEAVDANVLHQRRVPGVSALVREDGRDAEVQHLGVVGHVVAAADGLSGGHLQELGERERVDGATARHAAV